MNSIIVRSGVAVATLCGALLVGCNSVEDVTHEPFTDVPTPAGVLQGDISGLGDARAVFLSYNGQDNCKAPDPADASRQVDAPCKFFGVAGQAESHFSFGSLTYGTPYNITVTRQPFGKICSVTNGSGSISATTLPVAIACADDPAVPRYDLTVNIAAALQALPNLTIRLATEEDVLSQDATARTSVVFPGVLINSGTNLPAFSFQLTATTNSTAGGATTTNFCTFAAGPSLTLGGTNLTAAGVRVVPTAPVAVTANACEFTASASVQYNGAPALAMPAGGLQLALRNHFTGVDEQQIDVAAFTAGPATVSFPTPLKSHARSMYELVVSRQPTGMHCIVAGTTPVLADTTSAVAGVASVINAPTASAVMLIDPRNQNWWAYAGRQVRCRAVPAAPAVLVGTYQMDARIGNQPNTDPPRAYGRGREFLTFFDDGTFLYAINANSASYTANHPNSTFSTAGASVRGNWAASSGVTHGFYAYNSVAGTITFTVITTTVTNSASRGIIGMPGYAAGAVTATGVVKGTGGSLGTLAMTFTSGPNTRLWTMTEPERVAGELTGTWVSADHRRVVSIDQGTTFFIHYGVNGLGNLQETCLLPTDDSTPTSGVITRHSGSATDESFVYTCTPGIWNKGAALVFARNVDLPHYTASNGAVNFLGIGPTTPQAVPGAIYRFPGTQSQLDNRPTSPVLYQVTPGNPDTLNIRNTLNGTPIDLPLTFTKQSPN